jgi:ABC-2 type transport system permease protein/lipopolysaccharide transport system permease protein
MSLNPSLPYDAAATSPPLRYEDEADLPASSRTREALYDLAIGLRRAWLWSALAYQDIRLRYRGSVLGPFWVTLSNLILLVAMGGIYGTLFHARTAQYIPFLMCGLAIWGFIATLVNEGCTTFTAADQLIRQVPLPFSIQAYRTVYRNLLVLAHNAIVIPFGLAIFRVPVSWRVIEALPALMLICIDGIWISLLLGTISARFRDIPPIVANMVNVIFFATPVFWPIAAVGHWRHLLALNPLFAAVDLVRAPLLGGVPEPTSWPVLLAFTLIGSVGGLTFFIRFRERIAYWL